MPPEVRPPWRARVRLRQESQQPVPNRDRGNSDNPTTLPYAAVLESLRAGHPSRVSVWECLPFSPPFPARLHTDADSHTRVLVLQLESY